jgi:light-regulated signal transduction histidine kinase (bacteriophytochrome)
MAAMERNLDIPLREVGAVFTHDPGARGAGQPAPARAGLHEPGYSNAIKFRRLDEQLRTHVGARRIDGFLEFSVSDNGIGIAPDYLERIFVIFQRLHTKDAYPGTGIGLAIVKRIIDRHGGRIWVESTPAKARPSSPPSRPYKRTNATGRRYRHRWRIDSGQPTSGP